MYMYIAVSVRVHVHHSIIRTILSLPETLVAKINISRKLRPASCDQLQLSGIIIVATALPWVPAAATRL